MNVWQQMCRSFNQNMGCLKIITNPNSNKFHRQRHIDVWSDFKPKRCTGLARPVKGWLMTEDTMEGKNWKWCHPATSRSTYPQMVVVNSLSLQYAVRMVQIQWAPAYLTSRSSPITSRGRTSLQFVCLECHSLCVWNLGPNPIWSAPPATQ